MEPITSFKARINKNYSPDDGHKYCDWIREVDVTLGLLRTRPRNASTYRVPSKLRAIKHEAYTPQMVSIGPFHRHNPELRAMDELKWRYMLDYVDRVVKHDIENNPVNEINDKSPEDSPQKLALDKCSKVISELEEKARAWYAEDINLDKFRLVEMLLVDAQADHPLGIGPTTDHCVGKLLHHQLANQTPVLSKIKVPDSSQTLFLIRSNGLFGSYFMLVDAYNTLLLLEMSIFLFPCCEGYLSLRKDPVKMESTTSFKVSITKKYSPSDEKQYLDWLGSVDVTLGLLSSMPRNSSAYRVPNRLREVKNDAYTPQIVAIGPFHRNKPDFQAMEKLKWSFMLAYVDRVAKSDLENNEISMSDGESSDSSPQRMALKKCSKIVSELEEEA
ncbi:hypothetical protein DCAR_0415322 [Daucus carota subsp. sativus]|uniref:Uncharacterized protein n=1 Tax=Daucus carota subsp. sativus TaxID=79200 RepID=A0A162A8W3_DAUCS|nr:hypothetical protein DCAR_0415322 [Daucus carota subsp. sativus]